MAAGTVKFWKGDNGWGFIVPETGGPDVFCHIKDLRASGLEKLTDGQRVTFDVIPGKDGKPKANNIFVAR